MEVIIIYATILLNGFVNVIDAQIVKSLSLAKTNKRKCQIKRRHKTENVSDAISTNHQTLKNH